MKRTIYWEGQSWDVIREKNDQSTRFIKEGHVGNISPDEGRIAYRVRTQDIEIKTLLHEMLHQAFPQIDDDVEIVAAEVRVKTFLEAMGVDLKPMLEGYK